jgi:hypothetical protein
VERIFGGIGDSILKNNIQNDLHFKRLPNVIAKLVAVLGILVCTPQFCLDLKFYLLNGND